MKKIIAGIAILSLPLFTNAETAFVTEILIGQSQNKILSSNRIEIQDEVSVNNYSSSLSSDSLGFRFGVKFLENVSIELAKHDHGSATNSITISYPTLIPGVPSGGVCCLGPEHDFTVEALIPINIESIRLGVKGEINVLTNFSVSARLGIAHWKYKRADPQQLTNISSSSYGEESGNDLYYAIGAEYKLTENINIGLEYSLFAVKEENQINNEVSSTYYHDVEDFSLVLGWMF